MTNEHYCEKHKRWHQDLGKGYHECTECDRETREELEKTAVWT